MYYVLHGEDEFSRTEQIDKMRAKMGDPQFADLNITRFDGRKLTLGELRHACDAVPFLLDKRLVIVENMLSRFDPRRSKGDEEGGEEAEEESNPKLASELAEYLTHLPESARLVFVESKSLAKTNPILKQAGEDKKGAYVKEFQAPTGRQLPHWVEERVSARGGQIEPPAVAELAIYVGSDLRLLDTEIEKLLTYRGGEPVRPEDVRMLVSSVHETSIFELVDAVGRRETNAALKLLHDQLDHGAAPLYLLSMIIRQFRLLLQMKDLAERGLVLDQARTQLKMHPFVAQKTWSQALNFTQAQLEATYRRLLQTDLAIKTSRSEPVLALDMLVVELTRS